MVDSGEMKGVDDSPVEQPLTWRCPEGHVFRFRRRPLLSSCIFIFCFLIMERAAMFAFRSFLYRFVGKSLAGGVEDATFTYMWIAIFFGVYDVSPILLALVSDTYLGCFKAIVVFGFTFVFGLTLAVLSNSISGNALPPIWLNAISLLIIAISSGGLTQLLVAFGGGQFHPRGQTSSGSRFFSLIYVMAGVGAIIGIVVAALVWNGGASLFYTVLLSAAVLAGAGWICFLSGTWLYVDRCIHPSSTLRIFSLAWDCIKQRSFDKNIGKYSDKMVRDVRLVARLIPIFLFLIPLYSGQLQSLTTLRNMEKHMSGPRVSGAGTDGNAGSFFCYELLLIAEPVTMIVVSLLLNEIIFPLLKRWRRGGLMITHLSRFVIASGFIAIGFIVCLLLQRRIVTSELEKPMRPSVFLTLIPIVLFAIGQLLVTSSGLELSWSHAPNSLRSVSVAIFSSIYALGSWISLALFGAFKTFLNNDSVKQSGVFESKPSSGLEIYYGVCAGLAGLSLVGLLCMRGFYERTRQMKIERDIEERAIEIALARLCC
jgi:hypothetical protein